MTSTAPHRQNRRLIRPLTCLAVLGSVLATTTAVSAQTSGSAPAAAARLPNSFDRPVAQAQVRPAPQTASAEVTPAEVTPADRARAERAEAMLTTTVAALRAGTPNYGDMSPDVGAKMRRDLTTTTALLQSFGTMQSMAHVGVENGAQLFMVGFERQITQWIIAQDAQGKIVALLFRPVPPPTGG